MVVERSFRQIINTKVLQTEVTTGLPRGKSQTSGPSSANVAARIAPGSALRVFTLYSRQTLRHGALLVACGLVDGVAQTPELGRLAEHDMLAVLLLKGLVRSHRQ
jgi:hypothetical protein